jgi:hypothetical protein
VLFTEELHFGPHRWEYYRMTNRSHNTLVIGDNLQNTAAVAKVVDFGVTPSRVHATHTARKPQSGHPKPQDLP